ncbi:MAG: hypothetical protein ABJ360_13295 [Roseobacter sp.]|uniref:hypothetical protein n=1 Tax=Tateyamaria sp. TaxID=1929288 RepID=UPI003277D079
MSDVVQFPIAYEPPEPQPEALEPLTIRIRIDPPAAPQTSPMRHVWGFVAGFVVVSVVLSAVMG